MCDHPMHVEPANRAESSWKGDEGGCFPGHPSIETPWKPHVLAQVPFNSNLFFCAQQHCLLLAQMEAQRQHFGLARRGRWLRLRVPKHLVPSGDNGWQGNPRSKWRFQ